MMWIFSRLNKDKFEMLKKMLPHINIEDMSLQYSRIVSVD